MVYYYAMKNIILFRSSFCRSNLLEHEGVFRYAREHGWRVQAIEYMNAAVNRFRTQKSDPASDVASLLKLWRPDGCIVECGIAPDVLHKRDFGKTPAVFLDRDPDTIEHGAVCVYSDSDEIASTAAKELLQLGIEDFAYIAWPDALSWSVGRGKMFASIIRRHGKNVQLLSMPKTDKPESDLEHLSELLSSLRKPCGLFTANDVIAKHAATACEMTGIPIPDDMPIVSVDNDEDICEHLPVTLTSIELDFMGAGRKAAELLDLMMSGKTSRTASAMFGVNRIVRRESATGFRHLDKRMCDALEFIRLHSCERITSSDVAKAMQCSRRYADMRFREALGSTILNEIQNRRICAAKERLRLEKTIDDVAKCCGYTSAADFRRVFKRYVGVSPLKWLKSQ